VITNIYADTARGRAAILANGNRGVWGMGDTYDLAHPENPCAPGLELINGSCFRSPGTQSTPYGEVAIPLAGPSSNLTLAASILGGGAVCQTERVDAGPYAYEQNICRDAAGNILGGADLIAEHVFVQGSLVAPTNTAYAGPVAAGSYLSSPPTAPTPPPTPIQTATIHTPTTHTATPTAVVQTAAPAGAPLSTLAAVTGDANVFGFDIPIWALVLGGLGAVWAVSKIGGGR